MKVVFIIGNGFEVDIFPTNGADKRKFSHFFSLFSCHKCDKAVFLSLLSRHNWYKRVFFPLFSLFIGDNEDKNGTLFPIFPS